MAKNDFFSDFMNKPTESMPCHARGGSLPEILNYLPDGGQFSRVPLLIQVQVKFLCQICVRKIVQYNWK